MMKVCFYSPDSTEYRISVDDDKPWGYSYYRYFLGYSKRECLKKIREEIYKKFHVKRIKLIDLGEKQ